MTTTTTLHADATYASYAELSWEDSVEEEAEYRILRTRAPLPSNVMDVVMDWTTEKTFTDTGLTPASQYSYQIFRRTSDVAVNQVQDPTFVVTTKGSEIHTTDIKSTRLVFLYPEVYEGASLKGRLTPTGGDPVFENTVGARYTSNNSSPDTEYTFELFVVEQGEWVLLDTLTASTHRSGVLTLAEATHTSMLLNVQVFNPQTNSFYIESDDESIYSRFDRNSGDDAWTVEVADLDPGSSQFLSLYRAEFGEWVKQGELSAATKSISPSISVGPGSATVQWEEGYEGAIYEVSIYDEDPGVDTLPIQVIGSVDQISQNSVRSALVTGLMPMVSYWGTITVYETNIEGIVEKIEVNNFSFQTSDVTVVFEVGDVKASSVRLDWSTFEGDEAEFMVRQLGSLIWTNATTWIPHTGTSSTTITGLDAGKEYHFELVTSGDQSKGVVDVTTKNTSLTLSSTPSQDAVHTQVDWASLYDGASYKLTYMAEGENLVTFGGGPIADNSALLTDLENDKTYALILHVIEDGQAVQIASGVVGPSAKGKLSTYTLVGVAIAVIILFLFVKKKSL